MDDALARRIIADPETSSAPRFWCRRLLGRRRWRWRLATAKDALVGVVAVTGVATGLEGTRFARQAAGVAVPPEDGDHTALEASDSQRRKRRLSLLGLTSLAAELGLVGVEDVTQISLPVGEEMRVEVEVEVEDDEIELEIELKWAV
jgi:hypothetical protein